MRGLVLSFLYPSSVTLVGLLVLSTPFLWAQETLPLEKIPIQFLDAPAPFARVSEAQTPLHLAYGRLPLTFQQNLPHYPSYYRPPITIGAEVYPATRAAESWSKSTFPLTYSKILRETTGCVGDLEHYGHHIPWASSIILRVLQQAKAHPHITRVLTVFKPQF
jgi:hypothetical protein